MNRKATKLEDRQRTVVEVGPIRFGHDPFPVVAGPCAVESETQINEAAEAVVENGGSLLRAGAFKSSSSPYGFRGLGQEGVDLLTAAGARAGLPTVTQVLEAEEVARVAEAVDVIEVGSGSMQDFELLRVIGKAGKPVMLRRGASATLDEWLWAAEYLLAEGNENVILVERGIRTFGAGQGDMLDIAAVPSLKELTHLPVLVDPSHASGGAGRVGPLALAAQGVGADGLILEVHPQPSLARSEGPLQLDIPGFAALMSSLGVHRLRQRVDLIDRQIVRLLSRRQELAMEIGQVKWDRGLPVHIPDREVELLEIIKQEAEHAGLESGHVQSVFEIVLRESRRLQYLMRGDEEGS